MRSRLFYVIVPFILIPCSVVAQNVGIGVADPMERLHIDGILRIDHASQPELHLYENGVRSGVLATAIGNLLLSNEGNGSTVLATNNLPRFVILNGGNIGVGEFTPEDLLHVTGNMRIEHATNPLLRLYRGNNHAGSLTHDGTNMILSGNLGGTGISLRTSNLERLHIKSGGQVYVGRNYAISSNEKFGVTQLVAGSQYGGMYMETKGSPVSRPFYGYAIDSTFRSWHYYDGLGSAWKLHAGGVRITVDSTSGNIGFGTESPQDRLHVIGKARIEHTTSPGLSLYQGGALAGQFYQSGNDIVVSNDVLGGGLLFQTGGMDHLYLGSGGKFFVGRDYEILPSETFGVATQVAGASFGGMYAETVGHAGGKPMYGYAVDGSSRAYHFYDGQSAQWKLWAGAVRLTVDSTSGNVGVGTVLPEEDLHVKGSTRVDDMNPAINLYQDAVHAAFIQQGGDNLSILNKEIGNLYMGTSNMIHFAISSTGNIGIGDNTPNAKLHVVGPTRIESTIPVLDLYQSGTHAAYLRQNGNDLEFFNRELGDIEFGTNDIQRMEIDQDGNVGIGVVPTSRLHIQELNDIAGEATVYIKNTSVSDAQTIGIHVVNLQDSSFGHGGLFEGGAYGIEARGRLQAGVYGTSELWLGVAGQGPQAGVYGTSATFGVSGHGSVSGVYGTGPVRGVWGSAPTGVYADGDGNGSDYSIGVDADAGGALLENIGIYATSSTLADDYAGYFDGDVHVQGNLSKSTGSFRIDHPLDPENKYLYHSFVESPDMMNIYNGNIVTDDGGYATVQLPEWFEALNKEFRYQLTVIGSFAQAIISEKVNNNQFVIRTNEPNIEVSWQVTGIRHDASARANRVPVEVMKPVHRRGQYQDPEAFGLGPEYGYHYQIHADDALHRERQVLRRGD